MIINQNNLQEKRRKIGGYFPVSPLGGVVRLEYPELTRVNNHYHPLKNSIFNQAIKKKVY